MQPLSYLSFDSQSYGWIFLSSSKSYVYKQIEWGRDWSLQRRKIQEHKIIYVEGTFWRNLFQISTKSRANLVKCLEQPYLIFEYCASLSVDGQSTASQILQSVPIFDHPHYRKKNKSWYLTVISVVTICLLPLILSLCTSEKSLGPSGLYRPIR